MTDEATQQGVSESEYGFGADRLARINAIQDDRNAERDPEDEDGDALAALSQQAEDLDNQLKEQDPDAEDDEGAAGDADEGDSDADEGRAAEGDDSAEDEGDDGQADDKPSDSPLFMEHGQWMTRVKVDGEIRTIPFARLQAAAQKLDAGDKRLEEANRLRQEIEQREQQLLQREQGLKNQPPAEGAEGQGQTETGHPNEETRALIKQYHEALLNGEDEETTSTLLEKLATAGRHQPQVDVSTLAKQVEEQVSQGIARREQERELRQQEAQREAELKTAYATFKDEFKDVVDDPQLTKMADDLTVTVAQEYPTYTPIEVMREAGKRTRQWLKEKAGGTVRTNRKRNLKTATGTGARQPGKPAEKPKTRTDELNEIRAARGQMPIG